MSQISFIHAADLHLDTPFRGLAHIPDTIFSDIRESTFRAFRQLVDVAIQKQVDFVLLVGDLFDNERQSLKAQFELRQGFERLREHRIHVYMSYGNHDYIAGNIHPINYPDNVYVFPDDTVRHVVYTKEGRDLATIYGFSYEERAIHTAKVDEYNLAQTKTPFHLAMLHGSLKTNTEHDVYAPFTLNDLSDKPFDYWALGHIHKRQQLKMNPPIIYPGNIQGRNRKETGEKGCYYVELSSESPNIDFIPLQSIQFQTVNLHVDHIQTIHQLGEVLKAKILNQFSTAIPQLFDVVFFGTQSQILIWKSNGMLEEVIELINDQLITLDTWKYIYRWSDDIKQAEHLDTEGDPFMAELRRVIESSNMAEWLEDLYHHREARKYLIPMTADEEEALKAEVKQLLFYMLHNKSN
ncbi:MAG TPA: DNA repair exonuclease [Cerasibacillus sp.]|uniref:metallophosphoesterase family protein n=1 Tax=Cerasibacillus sp. TaxID=2498711 RepID=UPI002F3E8E10